MRELPKDKAFYFFTSIGNYTGKNAFSFHEFLDKVKEVDSKSLEFHFYRRDFEKWIREVWGYENLAAKISEIEKLNLKGESLRARIYDIVSNFLKNQKDGKKNNSEKISTFGVEEYLKRLPTPPAEHVYELKMEKRLQHRLKNQKKKSHL